MRALQRLVRNGNSTHVAIPRQVLIHLGWLPGEYVVLDLLEDDRIQISRGEIVAVGKRRTAPAIPGIAAESKA